MVHYNCTRGKSYKRQQRQSKSELRAPPQALKNELPHKVLSEAHEPHGASMSLRQALKRSREEQEKSGALVERRLGGVVGAPCGSQCF